MEANKNHKEEGCCKGCSKDKEATTKEIYEEIKKLNSSVSLQKKLVCIQKLNEERSKLQDTQYETEYNQLKAKYDTEYDTLYDQMSAIVLGNADLSSLNLSQSDFDRYKLDKSASSNEVGIPNYWGKVLKHAVHSFSVNENDEKILTHLKDIKLVPHSDNVSFTVEFHFSENEYFTNSVLSKAYIFNKESHQVEKVERPTIDWKSPSMIPNKILKTKTVRKGKVKSTQTVEKEVETFFNIFNAPKVSKDDEAYADVLADEAEEGEFFKENLIPFSIEYYLDLIDVDVFEEGEEDEM